MRTSPFVPALLVLAPVTAVAALVALPFGGVAGCKASADQGTIEILTVDDPFVGPPAATEITVQEIAYDDGGTGGAVTTLARGSASAGTLDLGTYDETNTGSLLVTATDGAGTTVARGETLAIELGAVAGLTLGVFVQRTGLLSRMPSPLSDGRNAPIVSVLGGRYVFVAGGSDTSLQTTTQLYDLIAWSPLASPPSLPAAPASIAIAQLQALSITSTGAIWYDLTASSTADASVPPGNGAWADVAGGATITSTDQSTSFVVGATRASGAPTSAVLLVTSSGTLSWASLKTPRLGASAAWVDGVGLVVEGGNAAGDTSAGLEVLAIGATQANASAYPGDPLAGAGMTALDAAHVLVVGGTNAANAAAGTQARVFTIPCDTGTCAATVWQAPLPTALPFAQAFAIDGSSAFVVGEAASGAMHAYTITSSTAVEIPFHVARNHARAVRLPIGTPGAGPIAVVGGAPSMESFVP